MVFSVVMPTMALLVLIPVAPNCHWADQPVVMPTIALLVLIQFFASLLEFFLMLCCNAYNSFTSVDTLDCLAEDEKMRKL